MYCISMKFKEYDVADETVDEIIGDNYTIELPDGTFSDG